MRAWAISRRHTGESCDFRRRDDSKGISHGLARLRLRPTRHARRPLPGSEPPGRVLPVAASPLRRKPLSETWLNCEDLGRSRSLSGVERTSRSSGPWSNACWRDNPSIRATVRIVSQAIGLPPGNATWSPTGCWSGIAGKMHSSLSVPAAIPICLADPTALTPPVPDK